MQQPVRLAARDNTISTQHQQQQQQQSKPSFIPDPACISSRAAVAGLSCPLPGMQQPEQPAAHRNTSFTQQQPSSAESQGTGSNALPAEFMPTGSFSPSRDPCNDAKVADPVWCPATHRPSLQLGMAAAAAASTSEPCITPAEEAVLKGEVDPSASRKAGNAGSRDGMTDEMNAGCGSTEAFGQSRVTSTTDLARNEVGLLRRKPGRGEPTLSMSCSDKLARWGLLGLQVRMRHKRE